MAKKLFLSVIVPAYKNERKMPLALVALDYHLARIKLKYEILIIMRHSADKTKTILEKFQPLIANLRWISLDSKTKWRQVICRGLKTAKGEHCLFIVPADAAILSNDFLSPKLEKKLKIKKVIVLQRSLPLNSLKTAIDYLPILCQTLKINYHLKRCLKNIT